MVCDNVVSQFVSVFELLIANVATELLLLVPTLDALMPLQAVLPFVASPAVVADILQLRNARVGLHRLPGPQFVEEARIAYAPHVLL